MADLKGSNASTFAETFRMLVGNEIGGLDGLVSSLGGDVPLLTLQNDQRASPCDNSGTATINVTGNGADISIDYQACAEHGVTINGKVALSFTNVDAAARTFDYRITYTALTFTFGTTSETLNGTSAIQTEVINGVHVHRLVVDLTYDGPSATTYIAENLSVTARHSPWDYEALEVTAAAGAIRVSGRGFADIGYRPATGDIHFTGAGGSEVFVTLDGEVYAMRYQDAQGQPREVVVDAQDLPRLSVLDGRNSAPEIEPFASVTLESGRTHTLDVSGAIVDPDFEPVDTTLVVVNGPAGHSLAITRTSWGVYTLAAADSGVFTLRLTATDPQGARTEREFTVTVLGDADRDGVLDIHDPDDDNDGVPDQADQFPFDTTESHDADGDGTGDNADPDDDNDGVGDAEDAFPLDPACSSASAGNGEQCFLSAIENFDSLVAKDGILHFVSKADETVYRWDSAVESFLASWHVGTAVPSASRMTSAAYVPAHDRFYFGYDNGAITAVSPGLGTEQAFATVPLSVTGLADAGNFVMAQDASGAWATHYVFAADGALRSSAEWNRHSRAYAFNAPERRVYFFRDGTSPNDLHYEEIDQTTGARLSAGETPYHGAYGIEPPIVVSPAGDLILIGSGNLFNAGALTWAGAIPGGIAAAHWDAADGLIVVRTAGPTTVVERRDVALSVVERRVFPGTPRAIARVLRGYMVVTATPDGLALYRYEPSNDSDADGVSNTVDAFPLDVAASIDTDSDGYPDGWNGGRSEADSTTGLVIDAYPTESACYLPEHGDGTTCNVESTIPNYLPERVVGDVDGVAYLLSVANKRVYRYSAAASVHLSPIVVGADTLLNGTAPSVMEYSPQHERLYFGYSTGAVTYVDLNDAQLRERPFTTVATAVRGLGAAGDYLAVQDDSGAWATHYYFDRDANMRASADWNRYSRDYEWNATLRRLFFFRDETSPNDLHFEQIGVDGTIESEGETPYHGGYVISPPIVMSPDDQYVLLGGGDIFRASDLTWHRSILNDFVAAVWDDNGSITAIEAAGAATTIHRYDANQVWQSEELRAGVPLALLEHSDGYVLVTHDGNKPVFSPLAR